jgi:hypothetical protein
MLPKYGCNLDELVFEGRTRMKTLMADKVKQPFFTTSLASN